MKKIRYIVILSLIAVVVLSFTACAPQDIELPEKEFITANANGFIFENHLYYHDLSTHSVKYMDLTNLEASWLPLYSDAIASSDENPFSQIYSFCFMAVDPEATAKNNGNPVLIMAFEEWISDVKNMTSSLDYKIISFQRDTNKITVIKDKIKENIQSLGIYGDTIIYTTNEGELGYNIHRIDKDGSNYVKMDNPNKELYRVQTAYKDKIYFVDGAGQLFSCSMDFKDKQYHFDIILRNEAFIKDDYIYYFTNYQKKEYEGYPFFALDLCRRHLSDLSKTETVLTGASSGMSNGENFYYYLSSPRFIAGKMPDEGFSVLYEYSFETGDSRVVYDIKGKESMKYGLALGKDYILYQESDYSQGECMIKLILHDLKADTETILSSEQS